MAESITIKSPHEIEIMRQAAKITAGARSMGRQAVRDGLTTKQIDRAVHEYIVKCGAFPSCLGYEGFPAATCVSVNDEVIHGIPGKRIVRNGDIVSIDLCATYKGFVGDCAGTYPVGEVSEEAKKLIESGGRLIKPMLKDKIDYYSTVGIFFNGETEPTPWNLREIEAACRATEGMSQFRGTGHFDQIAEMWKNAPQHRKAA